MKFLLAPGRDIRRSSSVTGRLIGRQRLALFAGATLAGIAMISSARAVVINSVDFTSVYDGNALPQNSTPAWTRGFTGGGGTSSLSSGILTLTTTAAQDEFFTLNNGAAWSPDSDGTTIELNLKVDSMAVGASRATILSFGDASRVYSFNITTTTIEAASGGQVAAFDTTSGFATFRVTLAAGSAKLYVNNSATPAITGFAGAPNTNANRIYFGDGSSTAGGAVQFDYVAFTNDGAFAPVPEPSTLAFLMIGGLAFVVFFRRRRQVR